MAKVGFIGLGVMGYPMAGHLQQNHEVTVYNRSALKAFNWVGEHGGSMANSPAKAADGADFVFCCVGNDDDLRDVTIGKDGAFQTLKPGAVFIDNTTASAKVARELYAQASGLKAGFLDAPVSGGQAGAENGALTVMVGGDEADYVKSEHVIACYGANIRYMGETGSGQLTKMVNQICLAGVIQGLAEGIHFAGKVGLESAKVFDLLANGAAGSWQMTNRCETMIKGEYNFGFAVDWMRKDLAICLLEAKNKRSSLPITALIDQFYAKIQANGNGRFDTSALLTLLEN